MERIIYFATVGAVGWKKPINKNEKRKKEKKRMIH